MNFQHAPNTALDSGLWTQSIIWDARTPFRDFTQLEVNVMDEYASGAMDGPSGNAASGSKPGSSQFLVFTAKLNYF